MSLTNIIAEFKADGLPTAYALTGEELRALGEDPEKHKDIISEIVSTYTHMFTRPAMWVGRGDDPQLFLHLIEGEMAWLNYLCRCLPIHIFWEQKQLGAQGPFSILRDRVTGKQRPLAECFAAIEKLTRDHLAWVPKHIVIRAFEAELVPQADSESESIICQNPTVNSFLREIEDNKWQNQVLWGGQSFCYNSGSGNPPSRSIKAWVISRELDSGNWWDNYHIKRAQKYRLPTNDEPVDTGSAEQSSDA